MMTSTDMGGAWGIYTRSIPTPMAFCCLPRQTGRVGGCGWVAFIFQMIRGHLDRSHQSGDSGYEQQRIWGFCCLFSLQKHGHPVAYNGYYAGPFVQSDDSGGTWTQTGCSVTNWFPVACSAMVQARSCGRCESVPERGTSVGRFLLIKLPLTP